MNKFLSPNYNPVGKKLGLQKLTLMTCISFQSFWCDLPTSLPLLGLFKFFKRDCGGFGPTLLGIVTLEVVKINAAKLGERSLNRRNENKKKKWGIHTHISGWAHTRVHATKRSWIYTHS